jgi:hypothetical protein
MSPEEIVRAAFQNRRRRKQRTAHEEMIAQHRQWKERAPRLIQALRAHDRDVNVAKNILAMGLTVSAYGEMARPAKASARDGRLSEVRIPRLKAWGVPMGCMQDAAGLKVSVSRREHPKPADIRPVRAMP